MSEHGGREAGIEARFIRKLTELGYTYRDDIKDRYSLEKNFREHFNRLNRVNLTDKEFNDLKEYVIKDNVFEASKILRTENYLEREDGTPLYYTLLNIKEWCKNKFEVINQLRINTENSYHRYDVLILMNGVPVVQIELKEHETNPKAAMEQIVKYKNDQGNGYTNSLLCFVQLFIVSNEYKTYYFANNNGEHFKFNAEERFLPVYTYADEDNKKITRLSDFSEMFLEKCLLAELISRYMVLVETDKKLLIMRPYQIYAVKAILNCIKDNRGSGYIWHTTGSGKTLTSFKASVLLKENNKIDKCLFVVDRKDLDSQTREEFNKFQKGCVEENTNTESLVARLLSDDIRDKIIVTTIQKLGIALDAGSKQNKKKAAKGIDTYDARLMPIKNKKFVIIFDECHRSQFGEYHEGIKKFFPNSQLFGFTGTPIFRENATRTYINGDNEETAKTTESVFEKELHKYTITNAIDDKNVLQFHIDYYDKKDTAPTYEENTDTTEIADKKAPTPTAIKHKIAEAILNKHDSLTDNKRFNAVFATAKINDAIEYYKIFKEKQSDKDNKLNIACIFSPPSEGNKDIEQLQEDLEQEREDNKENQDEKKAALREIICDYNRQYKTNFDLNKFDEYYKDIQGRIKAQQDENKDRPHNEKIDITIVVDMLLTGFDSKYLNTLYVDKNLKHHGLIQAFSRTNRVLNATKPHGNIIDFRNQQAEVDEAVALFSGLKAGNPKEIWIVEDYKSVQARFNDAVEDLKDFMNGLNLEFSPSEVCNIPGYDAKMEFVEKFREIQRLNVRLSQYTEIPEEDKKAVQELMPDEMMKGFRGEYLEVAKRLSGNKSGKGMETGGEPKEIKNTDFEFVIFSSAVIDYDYIMSLISRYTFGDAENKEEMTKERLISLLRSYSNLLDERDDIADYVETLKVGMKLNEDDIKEGYKKFKENKRNEALRAIAGEFNIDERKVIDLANDTLRQMSFRGDMLDGLFDESLNWKERAAREDALMKKLIPVIKRMAEGNNIRGLSAYDGE